MVKASTRTASFSNLNSIFIFALMLGLVSTTIPASAKPSKLPKKAATKTSDDAQSVSSASGASADNAPGEAMKFNTNSTPASTDPRLPMTFSDPGATPLDQPKPEFHDAIPEEAPYQAYLGYPKHQVGVNVEAMNMSSTWNYKGQDFNFNNSPIGLDLDYRLLVTPMWNIGLSADYYSMKLDAATVYPYAIQSSTETYFDYAFKMRGCIISKYSFYRQLCPGLDIGNDSYPILKFDGSTNLKLSKVQDVTVGVNLTYQESFNSERFLLKLIGGYSMGTGLGNSGALTSKHNNTLYGTAETTYEVAKHHSALLGFDFKSRDAKLSGKVGVNDDTWTTKATMLGFKVGYVFTCP